MSKTITYGLVVLPMEIASIWTQPNLEAIKPSQLDIKAFNGNVLKWQEFWDAFDASVHKVSYAPVDKFNYMKSKFEGEALEAISGYQLSNENYTVVIDLHKKHYSKTFVLLKDY